MGFPCTSPLSTLSRPLLQPARPKEPGFMKIKDIMQIKDSGARQGTYHLFVINSPHTYHHHWQQQQADPLQGMRGRQHLPRITA